MRAFVSRITLAALILFTAASGAVAGGCGPYYHKGQYVTNSDGSAARYRRTPYSFYAESFAPLWLPPFSETVYRPWVVDVLTELQTANRRLDWNLAHCRISVDDYARLKNDIGRIRVQALGTAQLYQGSIPALRYITLRHNLRRLQRML